MWQQKISVELEDGKEWVALADQRDVAAWEAQPFYSTEKPHTIIRFMAWSASSRSGQTELSWTKFNVVAVECSDFLPEEPKPDPTNQGQPEES